MITYFKHTNGESFTSNSSPYVGYFHVLSGSVYSGKYPTTDSVKLTPNVHFLSKIYGSQLETDTTYKTSTKLTPFYSNTFDLLNKQGLDKFILSIDNNNILCYKSLILGNPTIFKYEENNGKFYGFHDPIEDEISDVSVPFKRGYNSIRPFSETINFKYLDEIKVGTFVVDTYENFKYICANNSNTYILSGNFVEDTNLDLIDNIPNVPYYNTTHQIHNDTDNSKLVFVKNDVIEVYDSSNYDTCDKLILIDRISLLKTSTNEYIWNIVDGTFGNIEGTFGTEYITTNPNYPEFIKFGNNVRTSISNNILYIINKYSSDIFQTIDLSLYDLGEIIDLDIRSVDDSILILNKKSDGLYVFQLDIAEVTVNYGNKPIYSINLNVKKQNIKFSDTDSNVFYTYNEKEYQSRYISNPAYPSGRLETLDLGYLEQYVWNTTGECFNFMDVEWNSNSLSSNSYNNLIVTNMQFNDKMYMLLHNIGRIYAINQPMNDRFLNSVPLDLIKYFGSTDYSESSLGLHFNTMLSNLLKDTLNIFNKSESAFSFEEYRIIQEQLNNFTFQTENLYLNGNETINVVALQRIMTLITDIQTKLLPLSIEN
jgi:hypothetical protein